MASTSLLRKSLEHALTRRELPAVAEELAELSTPFLRVSGLASCGRRQTFAMQGAQPTLPSFEGTIMMIQGDWGEEGMRKLLAESGYQFRDAQRELSHHNEQGIEVLRGHIDGLIGFDGGVLGTEWHLWENKMMSAFRYKKLAKADSIKAESPEYYTQVQLYMHLLREQGEEIESCLFTAVAKDPSAVNMGVKGERLNPVYIEEILYDQPFALEQLQRAEAIHKTGSAGYLWPHERNPLKDWDCSERFCPFFSKCDPKSTARRAA